jgi:hypothetical protein
MNLSVEDMLESSNSSQSNFNQLFENRFSKNIIVVISFFINLISIGLSYGIVWYEHYGSDSRRTLMNKLVASIFQTAIIGVLLIQLSDLPRYYIGPLPVFYCFLQSVFKNSVKWQCLLLLDSVIIARYIFIFKLKNPGAVQDDFWSLFVNITTMGISFLSNFVIFSLPGRKPLHYYTCADIDPTLDYLLPHSSGNLIKIFSINYVFSYQGRMLSIFGSHNISLNLHLLCQLVNAAKYVANR